MTLDRPEDQLGGGQVAAGEVHRLAKVDGLGHFEIPPLRTDPVAEHGPASPMLDIDLGVEYFMVSIRVGEFFDGGTKAGPDLVRPLLPTTVHVAAEFGDLIRRHHPGGMVRGSGVHPFVVTGPGEFLPKVLRPGSVPLGVGLAHQVDEDPDAIGVRGLVLVCSRVHRVLRWGAFST